MPCAGRPPTRSARAMSARRANYIPRRSSAGWITPGLGRASSWFLARMATTIKHGNSIAFCARNPVVAAGYRRPARPCGNTSRGVPRVGPHAGVVAWDEDVGSSEIITVQVCTMAEYAYGNWLSVAHTVVHSQARGHDRRWTTSWVCRSEDRRPTQGGRHQFRYSPCSVGNDACVDKYRSDVSRLPRSCRPSSTNWLLDNLPAPYIAIEPAHGQVSSYTKHHCRLVGYHVPRCMTYMLWQRDPPR